MKLSDRQMSLLLEEIAAMIAAKRPVALGLVSLQHPVLGRLGASASRLSKEIESGRSLANGLAELSTQHVSLSSKHWQTLLEKGEADAVYQIAQALSQSSDNRIRGFIGLVYPAIMFALAYGLLWVIPGLVGPLGGESMIDQVSVQSDSATMRVVRVWTTCLPWFWVPPVLFFSVMVIWVIHQMFAGKPVSVPWVRSANRYHAWATFCDLLATQVRAGIPAGDAIEIATAFGSLSGYSLETEAWSKASIDGRSLSQETVEAPRSLGSHIATIFGGISDDDLGKTNIEKRESSDVHASTLNGLAMLYRERAQECSSWYLEWLPLSAAVMLVGMCLLGIIVFMIAPVYQVFLDLI